MLETGQDPAIRNAYRIAHEERARAFRDAMRWILHRNG